MASCEIIPRVTNPKTGALTESSLYKGLLDVTNNNRALSTSIYLKAIGEDVAKTPIERDSLNEVKLESLLEYYNKEEVIPDSIMNTYLSNEVGENKNDKVIVHEASFQTNRELARKAIAFNNSHRFSKSYTATIESSESKSKIKFVRSSLHPGLKEAIVKNETLYEKIVNILSKAGVGIRVMDKLDIAYAHAYTDFSTAKRSSEGLLEFITIANTHEGYESLPEEFTHVVLEMLGEEHPLVSRLYYTLMSNPQLVEAILGESVKVYSELHNNDEVLLMKEAAAKVIAEALKGNMHPALSGLLSRINSSIKDIANAIPAEDIAKAIAEVYKVASILADKSLDGSLLKEMYLTNIKVSNILYNANSQIENLKKVVETFTEIQFKKHNIALRRGEDKYVKESGDTLESMMNALKSEDASEMEGSIIVFMNNLKEELWGLNNVFNLDFENVYDTLPKRFSIINTAIQTLKAVDFALSYIDEDIKNSTLFERNLRDIYNSIAVAKKHLEGTVRHFMYATSVEQIEKYGEDVLGDLSQIKVRGGKNQTLREMLEQAPHDISTYEMWLSAASSTSDNFIRIMHRIIKHHKHRARLKFIEINKKIQKLGERAERDGITDWSFMYKRDENGNILPEQILLRDYAYFFEYIKENNIKDLRPYLEEGPGGYYYPKESMFPNKDFQRLTPTQQKYLSEYLTIKADLDHMLPHHKEKQTYLGRPIFIRKNKHDRLAAEGIIGVKRGIKDEFVKHVQDIDIQHSNEVLLDFANNPVLTVPINYVKMSEGEEFEKDYELSDAISGLSMYAHMATNFREMTSIIGFIETSKEIAEKRKIAIEDTVDTLSNEIGTVISQAFKRKGTSNFLTRYYSMLEDVVYGVGVKSSTLGNSRIDAAKLAGNLGALNGTITMSLNLLNTTSNILNGFVQNLIEGAAAQFFSTKDILTAEAIYMGNAPEIIADQGRRMKENKVSLANELFDTIQGFRVDSTSMAFNKKRWIKGFLSTETLSAGNSAGEHFLHSSTMIAILRNTILKDKSGKEVNMWDALEVVGDSGVKSLTLKLGEYTFEGKPIKSKKDFLTLVNKLSVKITKLNQKMYGIYNTLDKAHAQRYSLGVLALMYRKWIAPSFERRFEKGYYDYEMETDTEGYYRTSISFIYDNILKPLFGEGQLDIMGSYNRLSDSEKRNIMKSFREVIIFALLNILTMLLYDDDDDKPYSERTWSDLFIEYTLRRLSTEMGVMIPSTTLYTEATKIISTPIVAFQSLQHLINLTGLLNPYNYESFAGEDAIIQSGRFKDWSKAQKLMFKSPFTLFVPNIEKAMHPEYNIEYFKKEDVR